MALIRGFIAVLVGYVITAAVAMGIVRSLFDSGVEPSPKSVIFALLAWLLVPLSEGRCVP